MGEAARDLVRRPARWVYNFVDTGRHLRRPAPPRRFVGAADRGPPRRCRAGLEARETLSAATPPNHRGASPAWMAREVPAHAEASAHPTGLDVTLSPQRGPGHADAGETVARPRAAGAPSGQVGLHVGPVSNHSRAWAHRPPGAAVRREAGIGPRPVDGSASRCITRSTARVEVEILPACAALGLSVSSLQPDRARRPHGQVPQRGAPRRSDDSRARGLRTSASSRRKYHPATLAAAARLAEPRRRARRLAGQRSPCAFVLANPMIAGCIVGPRHAGQLDAYREALSITWTEQDEAAFRRRSCPRGRRAVPRTSSIRATRSRAGRSRRLLRQEA